MELGAVIVFGKDHKLEVTQTRAEIEQAIRGTGTANVPMISVTRTTGQATSVNARSIRYISEPR